MEAGAAGLTPVDYLLGIMRNDELDLPIRLDAAKAVAPYVHPRLAVIDSTVRQAEAVSPLNDEEKRARARAMILEAFRERPEPPVVIAGKPTLRVIEHEPATGSISRQERLVPSCIS
jgi:hypothetical protein